MNYNVRHREIVVGIRRELELPRDSSAVIQIIPGKPAVTIVQSYQTFRIPKDRDDLLKALEACGKVVYQQDIVAYIPQNKELEDNLVHYLLELRNKFWEQGNNRQADEITEKLRIFSGMLKVK